MCISKTHHKTKQQHPTQHHTRTQHNTTNTTHHNTQQHTTQHHTPTPPQHHITPHYTTLHHNSTTTAPPEKKQKTDDTAPIRKHEEGTGETWQTPQGNFRIIVDNQQVRDVLMGYSPLTDKTLYHVCNRITNNTTHLLQSGWETTTPQADPIEWRPRELNTGADAQCNIAMDNGHNHMHINNGNLLDHNIFLQRDVGCRGTGNSALGWRILAMDNNDNTNELAVEQATTTHSKLMS